MVQNLTTNYYHGDGQIKEEDFVLGSFMQRKMYESGVMCSNCHNPHSLDLKFDGNQLCLQCHVPADYDTKSHHFHEEDTEASLCINCHMTCQFYMGNDFRRDHSFRIPRPDQSDEYGTPNACTQCHDDETNSWATNVVKEWYGSERAAYFSDEMLLSTHSDLNTEERRELEEFILDYKKSDIARATVIENLNFTTESDYQVLMSVLRDSSAIVKYQALMKFRPLSPEIRTSIASEYLKDSIKLVSVGAAQLVVGIDENTFSAIDKINRTKSLEELETMLFSSADFSNGRMQLGDYYYQKGDFNKAIVHYKMALRKDRLLTPVYSNLATTYSILNDYKRANETLDEWIEIEPNVDRPHYLKGLLYFETEKFSEAISELKLAIKLDPNDTRAMYNAATYYYQDNKDLALSEKYAKDALKVEPENGNYKYLLALIYQNTGRIKQAEKVMKALNPS
jgi:Tfp pilus assembly protein PilF